MIRAGVVSVGVASVAAVAVVNTTKSDANRAVVAGGQPIRATDLPIYPPSDAQCTGCHAPADAKPTGPTGYIHEGVHVARTNIEYVYHNAETYLHRLDDHYQTGKEHSRVLVQYLNEPDNTLPRAGAIAIGTAAGYILGLRHGAIRRLLYTGIGGGALASLCYPKDAQVYGDLALNELKGVAKIGYNFAYGVKPGDEPEYPKLPTNRTELLSAASDLVAAAKSKISSATIQVGNEKAKAE